MKKPEALSILGLSGEPSADEIKKAYRKQAFENHPDRNQNSPSSKAKFQKISEAYECLTKPSQEQEFFKGANGDWGFEEEILEALFRQASRSGQNYKKPKSSFTVKQVPCDVVYDFGELDLGNVHFDFKDLLFGNPVELNYTIKSACRKCLSNRKLWTSCTICSQSGYKTIQKGFFQDKEACYGCNGHGWIKSGTCYKCHDTQIVKTDKKLNVRIPIKQLFANGRFHLTGQGHENWNSPLGNVHFHPQVIFPSDVDNLSKKEKEQLWKLLSKL